MKQLFSISLLLLLAVGVKAQNIHQVDSTKQIQLVQAACGKCQFGMADDDDCRLAVRINGKAYHVQGTSIDEYGDAHAKDGFCNSIRKAEVQGEVKNNEFAATYFKLVVKNKSAAKKENN
jgi:hypothetical protein